RLDLAASADPVRAFRHPRRSTGWIHRVPVVAGGPTEDFDAGALSFRNRMLSHTLCQAPRARRALPPGVAGPRPASVPGLRSASTGHRPGRGARARFEASSGPDAWHGQQAPPDEAEPRPEHELVRAL